MNDNAHLKRRLLQRVQEPATEPVTLAEAKSFLRVSSNDDDSLISSLIVAARESAEEYLKKSFISQKWKLEYNDSIAEQIFLPRGPVIAIDSVKIINRDQSETIVDNALYYINAAKVCLVFDSTPEGHIIQVVYSAGYGATSSSVPGGIRQGILCSVAALYEDREISELPEKAVNLLSPYRALSL